ncbi:MAG: 50S ribosomal protein L17 [Cyanobacteria bacterium]|nr:50S ribosomal protein L17 [Cyanobacteriota bacterium]
MRHRNKVHHLGRPADQRNAMLRALATSLVEYDQITTTRARAKALKEQVDKLVTLAKRGDLQAIRQASRLIYHKRTGAMIQDKTGKEIPETVLRRLFRTVGPRFTARKGGYTRIVPAPPRRGDAAPMAVIEFVD